MADENDNSSGELELDDHEAEQLLADADDSNTTAGQSTDEASKESAKDWESEAKKWRDLSRKNEKSFKDAAAKLRKFEDEGKSESQRLQEDRDANRSRAEKAELALKRRDLAETLAPEHASPAQIRAVAKRLSGETDEELEADAKELFEFLAPEPKAPKTTARPKEKLRGGSEPDEDPEPTDPRKLAAMIPRRR
jgi:hypothetical protein